MQKLCGLFVPAWQNTAAAAAALPCNRAVEQRQHLTPVRQGVWRTATAALLGLPALMPPPGAVHCSKTQLRWQACCRCCSELPGRLPCSLLPQDTAFPDAFKWAAEADPTAQLCINDLSLIEAHNSPELIRIVKEHVWAHGAPIHCIGIQVP